MRVIRCLLYKFYLIISIIGFKSISKCSPLNMILFANCFSLYISLVVSYLIFTIYHIYICINGLGNYGVSLYLFT